MFTRRPIRDRHLRGPRRAVVVQRLLALGARTARRSTTPASRPPRCPPASRADGFPLAVQLVGRPGDEATLLVARRPDRGRAAVGGPACRDAVSCERSPRRSPARRARCCARRSTDRAADRDEEQPDRPRLRGRRRRREADPRAPARGAGPDDGDAGRGGRATRAGTSGLRWIVDPLDGTIELPLRHPAVGRLDRGRGRARACSPASSTTRCATSCGPPSAARPPTLDGEPLDGREHADELATALVATGFGYDADVRARAGRDRGRLLPLVRDIRRIGSAAIDLAWTAGGPLRRLLRARPQRRGTSPPAR